MEKTFTVERIGCTPEREYTVTEVTAIADCDDYNEEYRQDALLVTTVSDSGEKFEWVVFGFCMPEDEDDFLAMFDYPDDWDADFETRETVRIL